MEYNCVDVWEENSAAINTGGWWDRQANTEIPISTKWNFVKRIIGKEIIKCANPPKNQRELSTMNGCGSHVSDIA